MKCNRSEVETLHVYDEIALADLTVVQNYTTADFSCTVNV